MNGNLTEGPIPKFGVRGAAIATVSAQAVATVIMVLSVVLKKKNNTLKGIRIFARTPLHYLRDVFRIGVPTAIQDMVYSGITMVLTRMVSGFGAEAVAMYHVGGQIESISWNAADGFAAALNAFVAQNYGAEKNNRIRKGYLISLWMVGFWGLLVSALFLFFPRPLAGIFFHEPAAIAIAVDYLLILSLCEPFMCVEFATVGALSGLGKTQLCGVLSIALTGIRIPIAVALSRSMGLNGIWWALTATSVVKGILFTGTFLYITRKKND